MSKSIEITDPGIVSFYNDNPHLNVTEINRAFIDILKSLSTDMAKTFQNTRLGEITSSISSLRENMAKNMQDIRKEVQQEFQRTLTTKSMEQTKELNSIIERNSISIAEKVSKTQSEDKTGALASQLSNQVQQPLMTFMTNIEKRTKGELDKIAEDVLLQKKDGEKINEQLVDFLNKYKHSSSTKGAVSENMLCDLLNSILPLDEVIDCTGQTASGDFMINRKDDKLPRFIVENKDYTRKATTAEVVKFERDIQEQKCHGIFLSQSSDITFKEPYQVDIKDGYIHVYVPNVSFDQAKVKTAIDIVDSLSKALDFVKKENVVGSDEVSISKSQLELIAKEYKIHGEKRIQAIDSAKITLACIEELSLPSVNDMLIAVGKIAPDESLTCPFCKNYTGKNKSGLAAHTRRCKYNPKSSSYDPSSAFSSANNSALSSADVAPLDLNIVLPSEN